MDLTERFTAAAATIETPSIEWTDRWSRSGAASLSGRAEGPSLGVPAAMIGLVDQLSTQVGVNSARIGQVVDVDGLALLGERAALAGLRRQGATSCGGATRLLQTGDGWIALSLAREADRAAIPAWLELTSWHHDHGCLWDVMVNEVRHRNSGELIERASLLGLPCSRIGEVTTTSPLVAATELGKRSPTRNLTPIVVVDLSSLWAGPLCAQLLGQAGARIIKVESDQRPDGARSGVAAFYDLLHAGHESVALDFAADSDVGALRELIEHADVVIEASRPRALAQFGLDATTCMRRPVGAAETGITDVQTHGRQGPAVWLSITGYGIEGPSADRVAFGDDAAVAGGLVCGDEEGPCFCADAVADPITGLLGAAVVLDRLIAGGTWHVDIALSRTAAWSAGGPLIGSSAQPSPPRHRPVNAAAASIGRDTRTVLREFGISR